MGWGAAGGGGAALLLLATLRLSAARLERWLTHGVAGGYMQRFVRLVAASPCA